MGQVKDLDKFLEEAIDNIRNDRGITNSLLADLIVEMKQSTATQETHKNLGVIAAKYVETLQRSNEQLVKISSILHKKADKSEGLSEEDKNQLFDLIQESN